jgi:adenylate kinase family enzyme
VDSYLEQVFPLYKYITPSASAESDEIIARTVAEELLSSPGSTFGGFIVKGFPFNTNQALLLDRYINGVNLAIHLTEPNCAQNDESINNLLNYYDARGTLLRLPLVSNPSAEQLEFATREIVSNIKLSE